MNSAKLLRNLGSVGAMRAGSAALSFILFWLLSAMLGTQTLGAFALLFGIYLFAQYLPLLGLHIALVRDAANPLTDLPAILIAGRAIALPVSLLVGLLIGLTGWLFYPPELHLPFYLLGLALIPTALTDVAETTLMGQQRMGMMAVVNLAEALLRCVGGALAVALGGDLGAVFAVFLAGRLLAALIYQQYAGLPPAGLTDLHREKVWAYLRECPVYFAILVLSMLAVRLDIFMLSRLVLLAEVGVYAVAAKIYEALLMVPSVVAVAVYPALIQARETGGEPYRTLIGQIGFWALLLGVPCMIALMVLAPPLVALLFRPEFAAAANVLAWLAPAVLLTAIDQIFACAMLAANAQQRDMQALLMSVVLQAGLIYLLVGAYGLAGAAMAVMLSILARLAWRLHWFVRTQAGAAVLSNLLHPALAGAAGLVIAVVLPEMPWVLRLLASLLGYLGLLVVFGILHRGSLRQLQQALSMLKRSRTG